MTGSEDKYRDSIFAKLILKEGLLDKPRVETLLKEVKLRQKRGDNITLAALLVEKGLLQPNKEKELRRFLEKEIVTCPQCGKVYDVAKYGRGKSFQCKKCGAKITIEKTFSEGFQTTIKMGVVGERPTEEEIQEMAEQAAHNPFSKEEIPKKQPTSPEQQTPTPPSETPTLPDQKFLHANQHFHEATVLETRYSREETSKAEETPEEEEVIASTEKAAEKLIQSPIKKSSKKKFPLKSKNLHKEEEKEEEENLSPSPALHPPTDMEIAYPQIMPVGQVYPVELQLQGGKGVATVSLHAPGCLVSPPSQDILLSSPKNNANFWILPLKKNKGLATIQVWCGPPHRRKMAIVPLPFKASGRKLYKIFLLLALLLGAILAYSLFAFPNRYAYYQALTHQYSWVKKGITKLTPFLPQLKDASQAANILFYTLASLGGLLLLASLILWFVGKKKINEVSVQDMDFYE
ncbi:MAG: hypothetical protein D6805_09060 [Planctomycetota bacterium]|nr:MAG: hypothetical protein D6805_09060 [Planctomycetota bacterium]